MKCFSLMLVLLVAGFGCGRGDKGDQGVAGGVGPQGAAAPSPSPSDDVADVLQNGAHGNAYRLGLGQTQLSPGLTCQVQHILANQCLSNAAAGSAVCVGQPVITLTGTNYTYLYSGGFNQPNAASGTNNLIPTALQSLFVGTNYRIVCTGFMVIEQPGWYEFEDVSDDGSIAFLDGATLYNDGNHSVNSSPVTQSVYFDRDVHSFQVQYAQSGGGNFGFVLNMNNSAIPNALFYH